jgi:tRNA-uridine 2-sulfurtransferase
VLLKEKNIVVGMSGGVDSSVSAFLLKKQGAQVTGLFMRNWEDDELCPAFRDYQDVIAVASALDIPYYAINFTEKYWENVFSICLKQFERGLTPNPDILCNKEIKFSCFYQKAMDLGADFLATGHYCRTKKIGDRWFLLKGADPDKDQSYFLYTIKEQTLRKILFPVGDLNKSAVRKIAHEHNLITADKKDSTGICFIGKRDFRDFLAQFLKKKAGLFKTLEGKVVGEHEGAHFFTIGQRKGIGIGGQGEAWFVTDKDIASNTVFVVQGENHPALFHTKLLAKQCSWINDEPPFPLLCSAKIRYRTPESLCQVAPISNEEIEVIFETPQKAITPGQSIVFYQGEICLGGALIDTPK